MIPGSPLPNENDRIADLLRHNILDTEAEPEFDEIVKLAALVCESEIALVSLVDDHRQWFKSKVGLHAQETNRDIAFCPHALHGRGIFEVPDARLDERFHDNPLVIGDPHIRFYAGQPLRSSLGYPLGTLCVIDRHARHLSPSQRFALTTLARQVSHLLELRVKVDELSQSLTVIEEQRKSLERINHVKDQTLGVVVHDLRSPLASLTSTLDLFDEGYISDEVTSQMLVELKPYLNHTCEKMNKVLDWARDQVRKPLVTLVPFALHPAILDCQEWVQVIAEKKQLTIHCTVDPDLRALGDREWVEIILRNLASNAVKYSLKGGCVDIFANVEGEKVRIGVRDQGVGMDTYALDSILTQYRGVSTLGTAREQGTGLGLMLCQTYLANLNSQLEIDSQLNQGTQVSFLLPQA